MDAKLVATARGVQVTGVLLCLVNDDDLRQCQCFIDLSLEQAKTSEPGQLLIWRASPSTRVRHDRASCGSGCAGTGLVAGHMICRGQRRETA